MKDAYYFPHDSNARQDVKILKLRIKHGWAGYGLYWGIVEALRDQDEYSFDADDRELISLAVGCSVEEMMPVLETCLEIGLLVEEDGYIYSPSLMRRMKRMDEIREKRRSAGKKGGKSKRSGSNEEANEQATSKQKPSIKEKETKGNKRKEKEKEHAEKVEAFFEAYWEREPRKKVKTKALEKFKASFPFDLSRERLNQRLENFEKYFLVRQADAEDIQEREGDLQFLPYPKTWINQTDFDEPPTDDELERAKKILGGSPFAPVQEGVGYE